MSEIIRGNRASYSAPQPPRPRMPSYADGVNELRQQIINSYSDDQQGYKSDMDIPFGVPPRPDVAQQPQIQRTDQFRTPGQISTMQWQKGAPMFDGYPTPFRAMPHTRDMDPRRLPPDEQDEQDMLTQPPVVEGVPDMAGTQEERRKWEEARRRRRSNET